ncbi:hypothetical protein [Salinimonas lutimaris]|uniref:hypothetical protein n=1 Tax=Salinimonas lutimaris TaxID=914153 RepID=UPI0010BFDAEF|nr:hypothetical protein [Salinimonas lutimaris]
MIQNAYQYCPFGRCHMVKKEISVQALCLPITTKECSVITCAERPVFGADVTLSSVFTLPGMTLTEKMTELGWIEHTLKEKLYVTGKDKISSVFDTSTLAIKNKKPIVLVNCLQDLSAAPLFCFYEIDRSEPLSTCN